MGADHADNDHGLHHARWRWLARPSWAWAAGCALLIAPLAAAATPDSDPAIDALVDSILVSISDSLGLSTDPVAGRGTITLQYGCEVEGLRESFGSESLVSYQTNALATAEGAPGATDELEGLRFKERRTAPLGVLALHARTAAGAPISSWLEVETKAGEERTAVALEASAAGANGQLKDLSVRELLFWDREADNVTTLQNLSTLRWRPRLGRSDWRLNLRASIDLSRTDEADLEVPDPGTGLAAEDSAETAWLGFLNYEKVGLRIELARLGIDNSSLALFLRRKWVAENGSGAYQAVSFLANQSWFRSWGLVELDGEVERRLYDNPTAALGSYWEAEFRGRWMSEPSAWRLASDLRVTGTLYDAAAAEEDFSATDSDRLETHATFLVRRTLYGGLLLLGSGRLLEELTLGAGPATEQLWLRGGDGDGGAYGGRFELSARGGGRRRAWWLEVGVEAGRRNYRTGESSTRLTYEGFSLSLSQTDYTYILASILTGGDLPFSFAWEGYASLDREWHTVEGDDANLFSFSFALTHKWVLASF